jgi:hypothetical protein
MGVVMRKGLYIFFILVVILVFPICGQNNRTNDQSEEDDVRIKLIIGGNEFTAVLNKNETANAFVAKLPLTVNMIELNGNEKYYSFSQNLSSETAQRLGTINNGDLMVWSSNTLVLFYKTFSTNYSYIRIGRIENTNGLETALGRGNVEVTFIVDN